MQDELHELAGELNDRSREVKVIHGKATVPLKFDEEDQPATQDRVLFKKLSLFDLRFLSLWRKNGYLGSVEKLAEEACITSEKAEKLIKKLSCFRREEALTRSLAEIPTSEWIAAKHVQNVYEGGQLDDSSHKSLQELAKIEGAYKNNLNVNVTQNVFNLPKYDPETEAKLKAIADQEAMIIQEAEVVNG